MFKNVIVKITKKHVLVMRISPRKNSLRIIFIDVLFRRIHISDLSRKSILKITILIEHHS